MAKVSLNGLLIEVEHTRQPGDVVDVVEALVQAMAEERLGSWVIRLDRRDGGLAVAGSKSSGTRFDATLRPEPGLAVVEITGEVSINALKLAVVGGSRGLRMVIRERLGRALRNALSAA